ncbi:MAG: prolipoprotein diacylglyceryl transferase [bacterium]|nr:prolipoprotein diacylglyceryl transferase [bacterium]
MIQFPDINPVILKIGPLKIHWYGVMYLVGFVSAWILAVWRSKKSKGIWTSEQISDLIFYSIIGVLLGGRLGYIVFYNLSFYLMHPLDMFKVWDGGMSFHGGLIGVMIAFYIFGRKTGKGFFQVGDFIAPMVPIGLGAGRIGNFINGELWGKVSNLPWAMVFPKDPSQLPRQPSELYEFFLEGIVMFIILWIYSMKAKPRMAVSGLFLLLYGCFRFIVEFVRLPDPQLGYLAWGWLTMGQLLSIPMIVFGIIFIIRAYTKHKLVNGMNVDDINILKDLKQKKKKKA